MFKKLRGSKAIFLSLMARSVHKDSASLHGRCSIPRPISNRPVGLILPSVEHKVHLP